MQKRNAWLAFGLIALTLVPADDLLRRLGWVSCLACGDLETLDSVHNVLLFLPVGALLSRLLGGAGRAILAAGAASLGVEILQVALPSRDPSWVDVVMNTSGAAVGACAYWLWRARRAWTLAQLVLAWAGSTGLWLGATGLSGVLLQPARVPPQDLFGQWAPRRANFADFEGRVLSFDAGPAAMPHGPVPDPAAVRAALQAGDPVRLVVTRVRQEDSQPVLLARLVARNHEVLGFTGRRDTLQVRVRLRASDVGLRSPFVVVADPGRQSGGVAITAVTRPDSVALLVEAEGQSVARRMPLEVGLGWATIAPVEVELGAWSRLVTAVWLAVLAWPLGVCSGRAREEYSIAAAATALALVAVGLGAVPIATGLGLSHMTAWIGAIGGGLIGRAVGLRAGRGRGESRTAPDRPSL